VSATKEEEDAKKMQEIRVLSQGNKVEDNSPANG